MSSAHLFISSSSSFPTEKDVVMCVGCGCVCYCSARCKDENIEDHREECQLLANNAQSLRFFIDDKVRLLVRIYLKNKARLDHIRNFHPICYQQ